MDETERTRASMPSELRVGGMGKSDLLAALRKANMQLNRAAEMLFADCRFATDGGERVVAIAAVSVAELGFGAGATYGEIAGRALEVGLLECPLELGPHLRLKFRDQLDSADGKSLTHGRLPPGSLLVASSPLDASDETPKGFYLRHVDRVLWLRGYWSSSDAVLSRGDVLVFSKGRAA